MGKPFLVEEFGKEVHLESGAQANISSIRGPFYRKVYQQLQESLNADGPLKGAPTCWNMLHQSEHMIDRVCRHWYMQRVFFSGCMATEDSMLPVFVCFGLG